MRKQRFIVNSSPVSHLLVWGFQQCMKVAGTMQKGGLLKDRCMGPASGRQEDKQNEPGKGLGWY